MIRPTRRRIRCVTLALALAILLLAASPRQAGAVPMPVQSVQKNADGVSLKLSPGTLKLVVCDDRTIHVVYSPTDAIPDQKSFVVIKQYDSSAFTLKEGEKAVELATATMTARVDRATGSLTFTDKAGIVLLAEQPDGGKSMTPTVVNKEQSYQPQMSFVSPADEYLYGMGEHQDGTWNWRGIPIQLRQLNTECAMPMLLSSKGYGLLWDNASLTDFNPVDDQVKLNEKGEGDYTPATAGDYVLFAKDGNRSGSIGIEMDGKTVVDVKNMWVPYTVRGVVHLDAGKTVHLKTLENQTKDKAGKIQPRKLTLWARPLGDATTFRSEVGDTINYYVFYGPALGQVINEYRIATGSAPMWPRWAFGFWQCRERYSSQDQIVQAAAEFRKRNIPVDLIIQDWQYWGKYGWGACKFDEKFYPDPAKMIKDLHDLSIKYMISVWHNNAGELHDELKAHNGLIGSWNDVYNPEARKIRWKFLEKAFFNIGTDSWWYDCTEPGDDGNDISNTQCFLGSANRVRNAYPLFSSQDAYDGQRSTSGDKRVVILSRCGYLGQQRYGSSVWSGDIASNWITYRRQIAAGLHFTMTGMPYWTTDCGGFFRPRDQVKSEDFNELLTRWFQFATFCPIQRIHGYQTETEMWKFPLSFKNLLAYDELRHRMLPYTYSLAWRVSQQNDTIMRALPIDFGSDPKVLPISDQFMFGPAIMACPVTEPRSTSRKVYLPAGAGWVDFWTGKSLPGGQEISAAAPIETIPLFVRAGSILPLGPLVQYATEKPADPIELRVYAGADGGFTLYEDESDNYNYEKGASATISFHWNDATRTLSIGPRKGVFPGMLKSRTFRVEFVRESHAVGGRAEENADQEIKYDGEAMTVKAPAN